jgi:3-hydroxybutyryl-CoA dehydrogenase
MILADIKCVGIVGAGIMGHGIAQVFASAGYEVFLTDNNKAVLSESIGKIESNLKELSSLQKIEAQDIRDCLARISLVEDPAPSFQSCQVLIEAISEDLELKKGVFSRLEKLCPSEAVFCSNTSSIPIGLISEGMARKERVLGTHFWNPSNVMPCVEVIKTNRTGDLVFETIVALMKKIGKKPVKVLKDVPGFLGNRLQLALLREALFVVEEGIASPEDVDKVVKNGFGMRLPFAGPFELMDMTGHDVGYRVQDILFPELSCGQSAPKLMKQMVERGELGLKTGKGFYEWPGEKAVQRMRFRNAGLFSLMRLLKNLEEEIG